MDGTIDFIILEHDDVAGCALIAGAVDGVVPAIDGYNTPYVVAKGYDHATRNWEDCTLFDDIGTREVHVDDFTEKPEEVRLFLRTDGDVYLFGSSLGKSLAVEDADEEDIAYALREVRTYCKDATEKRDPQLICAKAQAAAAKSATAEGDAGGKKL